MSCLVHQAERPDDAARPCRWQQLGEDRDKFGISVADLFKHNEQ